MFLLRNEKALENTFTELSYHASVLDTVGMKENSVMVIHGGGYYGDKPAAKNVGVKTIENSQTVHAIV